MLLFNIAALILGASFTNFNTSNVTIQLYLRKSRADDPTNFNTSNVTIQH